MEASLTKPPASGGGGWGPAMAGFALELEDKYRKTKYVRSTKVRVKSATTLTEGRTWLTAAVTMMSQYDNEGTTMTKMTRRFSDMVALPS